MKKILAGLAALSITVLGVTALYTGTAHAANCGGQGAPGSPTNPLPAPPVPYTCTLPGKDITVAGVTRHFSAVVRVTGTQVFVDFTMSAPLPVDVPIWIEHHTGISGAGGTSDNAQGFILAGQTTATLEDSSPGRNGQLDVFAIFRRQDKGRVGGPWIQNGVPPVPTTAPPVVPPSTVPGTPTPPAPAPTTPPSAGTGALGGGGTLPQTGDELWAFVYAAAVMLLFGGVLWGYGVRVKRT